MLIFLYAQCLRDTMPCRNMVMLHFFMRCRLYPHSISWILMAALRATDRCPAEIMAKELAIDGN